MKQRLKNVKKQEYQQICMNFQMSYGEISEEEIPQILEQWKIQFKNLQLKKHAKHIFTHIEWNMVVYEIEVKNKNKQWTWVTENQMEKEYPLPTAFKKLITKEK